MRVREHAAYSTGISAHIDRDGIHFVRQARVAFTSQYAAASARCLTEQPVDCAGRYVQGSGVFRSYPVLYDM